EARGFVVPEGARTSRALVVRSSPSSLELRAEGPGLLVVTEGWDEGWTATVDDVKVRLLRVNSTHLGMALPAGPHRVVLTHRTAGFRAGLAFGVLGALALLTNVLRSRR
ncbi:MAG TPA: YfhO family protein, partial [Vicinamibacteria bacterium]